MKAQRTACARLRGAHCVTVAQQLLPVRLERLGGMAQLVVEHPPDRLAAFLLDPHQPVDAQHLAGRR